MRATLSALFLFGLAAIFFSGGPARAAPTVLASIKPVHSLVAAVMEGAGTPALLIAGGGSGHTYTMKPSDARKIARADIVFWIGPDLESFLAGPLANLGTHAKIVALENAKGIRLLAARPGGLWHAPSHATSKTADANPHIWLDPQNAIAMTRAIEEALAAADPAHAALYAANAKRETKALANLDRHIAARLAPVRTRPYIVFHDAYPYFETRYRLDAIGAVTVEPGRQISPRRAAALRDALKAGKAVCIFREPQFPPALIATLAAGTPARIGVLDPLGADLAPGPMLYQTLMTRMADGLSACLMPKSR